MHDATSIGFVEGLRRGVKWVLFRLAARGDVRRYVDLRCAAMRLLGRLGLYERAHLRFLRQAVGPGDLAVDAGAHFGIYTAALSALAGPRGRVVAFEPQTLVFEALQRRRMPHANTELHRVALSRAGGETTLFVPFVAGGVPEPALATLEPIAPPFLIDTIVTRTLDSYRDALRGLAFVKADLEGHEVAFLDGAREVLRQNRPLVQIEDNTGGRRLAAYLREGGLPGYALRVLAAGKLRELEDDGVRRPINFYLVPEPAADPEAGTTAGRDGRAASRGGRGRSPHA